MTHHGAALAKESGEPALPEAVASGAWDALPERMRALCTYALKLTVSPRSVREDDLLALRNLRLTDRDIVDANQVVAYFNYVNRVVEGLGVELEPHWSDDIRKRRSYDLRTGGGSWGR